MGDGREVNGEGDFGYLYLVVLGLSSRLCSVDVSMLDVRARMHLCLQQAGNQWSLLERESLRWRLAGLTNH